MMVMMQRCTQIITISVTLMGISVDKMHGIDAEKNRIDDTLAIPTTNRVAKAASVTINAGRNISAILMEMAVAASMASGT